MLHTGLWLRTTTALVLLALGACAGTPPTPARPAAAPVAAAPVAEAASGPALSNDTIQHARALGLKARKRNGATMYCKTYADTGSRLETEHCYSADVLPEVVRQMESLQDGMRQAPVCGSAGCAGSN